MCKPLQSMPVHNGEYQYSCWNCVPIQAWNKVGNFMWHFQLYLLLNVLSQTARIIQSVNMWGRRQGISRTGWLSTVTIQNNEWALGEAFQATRALCLPHEGLSFITSEEQGPIFTQRKRTLFNIPLYSFIWNFTVYNTECFQHIIIDSSQWMKIK